MDNYDERIQEVIAKTRLEILAKEREEFLAKRKKLITKSKNERELSLINSLEKLAEKETVVVETKEIVFPEFQKVTLEEITQPIKVGNLSEIKFPETQKVEGKVEVQFPETQKITGKVDVSFPDTQKVIGEVALTNLPKILDTKISNLPETFKIENFPKLQEVKITNPTETIKVSEFPWAEGQTASPKADPTKYIPVRLTNGKEFINALAGKGMSIGGGGGSVVPFINPDGTKGYAKLNNSGALMVDTAENGIPANDYQALAYDVNGNLSTITFKSGGVSGSTVATMTLGYDIGENLVSIATVI